MMQKESVERIQSFNQPRPNYCTVTASVTNYIGVDPASSGSKCDLNDVDLVEACLRM